MTNYSRIKSMTADEMTHWHEKKLTCNNCFIKPLCNDGDYTLSCRKAIKKWLEQEVDE